MTVFLLSSLMMACRKSNGPAVYDLGVDLQGAFNQDNVQVYIDDQALFNNKASTDFSWGLASSIGTTNTAGYHTIKVIVNDNTIVTDQFKQNSNLYIGIGYNKQLNKVSFIYSPKRFLYQ